MKVAPLCSCLALALGVASAQQLADDPSAYFGGINSGAYLDWLVTHDIETRYNASVYIPSIDAGLGAAIHWSVDDEYFHVAVAARASGWVGFGLSDVGGMLGADMALFSVNRPLEIVDAHAVETYYPKEDDCQRDWVHVNSSLAAAPVAIQRAGSLPEAPSEEFIMFEARRKLVTNDPQDLPIIRDDLMAVPERRIIAAWGDTPDVSFHGSNLARGSIRVYKHLLEEVPDFDKAMAQQADGSFFVGAQNYEIPGKQDTTYVDFCISRADLIAQGVPDTEDLMSIVGFKPILTDGPSAAYVHHYIVTGKFDASDDACQDGAGFDLVFVWAPGDGGLALPDFLGGSLFGVDGFQAFNVEIHYDNPRLDEGIIDSSGVEIFYTTTPRPVEMGVMQIGDPFITLYGEPVGSGLTGHHFECPGSCSDLFLGDGEPVTVLREYLHMHIAGTRATNEQIRNGTVVRTASTEVWNFAQNGNVPVKQEPYEVHPGDSFRMSCYYRGNDDTVFGLSSREEMCMAFLYYYPRKTYKVETAHGDFNLPFYCGYGVDWLGETCDSSYEPEGVLESDEDMHRLFGKQPEQCLLQADASAIEPAVDLEPPAVVAPTGEATREEETEADPKFDNAPAPEKEARPLGAEVPTPFDGEEFIQFTAPVNLPAPSLESVSSAASVCSDVALALGLFIASMFWMQ